MSHKQLWIKVWAFVSGLVLFCPLLAIADNCSDNPSDCWGTARAASASVAGVAGALSWFWGRAPSFLGPVIAGAAAVGRSFATALGAAATAGGAVTVGGAAAVFLGTILGAAVIQRAEELDEEGYRVPDTAGAPPPETDDSDMDAGAGHPPVDTPTEKPESDKPPATEEPGGDKPPPPVIPYIPHSVEGPQSAGAGDAGGGGDGGDAGTDISDDSTDEGASSPVGKSGNPMKVPSSDGKPLNAPTEIDGRAYSGHALDQMQARGISPRAVENTIQTGQSAQGKTPGSVTYYDEVNNLTAVTNSSGRVITVHQGRPSGWKKP